MNGLHKGKKGVPSVCEIQICNTNLAYDLKCLVLELPGTRYSLSVIPTLSIEIKLVIFGIDFFWITVREMYCITIKVYEK